MYVESKNLNKRVCSKRFENQKIIRNLTIISEFYGMTESTEKYCANSGNNPASRLFSKRFSENSIVPEPTRDFPRFFKAVPNQHAERIQLDFWGNSLVKLDFWGNSLVVVFSKSMSDLGQKSFILYKI